MRTLLRHFKLGCNRSVRKFGVVRPSEVLIQVGLNDRVQQQTLHVDENMSFLAFDQFPASNPWGSMLGPLSALFTLWLSMMGWPLAPPSPLDVQGVMDPIQRAVAKPPRNWVLPVRAGPVLRAHPERPAFQCPALRPVRAGPVLRAHPERPAFLSGHARPRRRALRPVRPVRWSGHTLRSRNARWPRGTWSLLARGQQKEKRCRQRTIWELAWGRCDPNMGRRGKKLRRRLSRRGNVSAAGRYLNLR